MARCIRAAGRVLAAAGLAAGLTLYAGCAATSEEEGMGVGRRLGTDAFVVLTSPVQIPLMSARDAGSFDGGSPRAWLFFPINFPLYLTQHLVFTIAHLADLLLAPVHPFVELRPLAIYEPKHFPMSASAGAHEALDKGFLGLVYLTITVALPILSIALLF